MGAPSRLSTLLCALAVPLALGIAPAAAHGADGQVAGVQTHLTWANVSAQDVERQIRQAADGGAGVMRVDIGWASLEEEGKGDISSSYLSRIDTIVDSAEAHGIELLFTLWSTPCWASTAPAGLKDGCRGSWWDRDVQRYPPARASDYSDALAFLADRYRGRVSAWEVWNEPNLDDFFITGSPVSEYAKLVKASYAPVKRADPTTTVIAGSLSEADTNFTEALYAEGVRGYFDAFSIHPYSGDRSPLDPGAYARQSFARGIPAIREVMLANGDPKPLWLTEFGWSTCTNRNQPTYVNCVDEATQARYLEQAFEKMQSWSYVPAAVWFNLEDTSADGRDRVSNYGLHRHDRTAKPAVGAFRRSAAALTSDDPPPPQSDDPSPPQSEEPSRPWYRPAGSYRNRRLTLNIGPRSRRVVSRGRAPEGVRVRLEAYRYQGRRGRWSPRPKDVARSRSQDSRYRTVLKHRRMGKGRWKIEAHVPRRALSAVARFRW